MCYNNVRELILVELIYYNTIKTGHIFVKHINKHFFIYIIFSYSFNKTISCSVNFWLVSVHCMMLTKTE